MRTTETDIRTMAFTLSFTWMCLCFLSLLALLLSLSLCQPFGIHRLSLHNRLLINIYIFYYNLYFIKGSESEHEYIADEFTTARSDAFRIL
jgi:hypothetical protein